MSVDLHRDRRARLADALRKAANAVRRAEASADLAAKCEASIIPPSPAARRLRQRIVALHRRSEQRHLAVARLYYAYAGLLNRQAVSLEGRALPFVAAVPAILGMQSASVTLLAGRSGDVVLASDRTAHAAQDLEFTLGEGPAGDCRRTGPLRATPAQIRRRWPHYGPAIADLGVHSLGAVPLQLAAAPVGSLVVFGSQPAGITADLERLGRIGGAFVEALLAEPGDDGVHPAAALPWMADIDYRPEVHQAAGILAHQGDCSTADALALLRARAFVEGANLTDVARGVVDGTRSILDD